MRILPDRNNRSERGSVLVTCMVLAALGTIGVAAWLSLLDARGHQVEQNLTALQRRAVQNNGRALARLAFYRNHLHDDDPVSADTTYALPRDLGSATIRSYPAAPLPDQSSLRYEKSGVVPLRSYTMDVQVDISDGVGTRTWQHQLKSYNPVLGGDLLVMNPPVEPSDPAPLVSGNLTVNGRAVFWDAVARDYSSGLRADEIHLPAGGGTTTLLDSSDNATAPLNYPLPRQTSGFAGAADPTSGGLDIVQSTANAHNSYVSRIQTVGPYLQIDGTTAHSIGPGPDTVADNPNDDFLEPEVRTQPTAYLLTELPKHYPLSSRILTAVARKTSPTAFTEDELFTIFREHIPLANDALTALMGPYRNRMPTRTDEFHRANGTVVSSDSDGVVRIFLETNELPHLIVENTSDLRLFGQRTTGQATAAAALEPRVIAVPNSGGNVLERVTLSEQNQRRMVLAVATEPTASSFFTQFNFNGSSAFPDFRMILELQNTGAEIDVSPVAGVNLIGGIRANRRIVVSGGTLTLNREYEYDILENLLARTAWVETYRQ